MSTALEETAIRKSFRRLVSFLSLMMFCAVMDRVNVGFAALSMNKDLGLSSAAFGFGAALFSLGYMLFEIPSNLILARVGARRWLARIMVTWALISMATTLAAGPTSFYVLRFALGAAEAGFLPGVMFYLGYWFPGSVRARTNAIFLIAMPLGQSLSALVSGPILAMDGTLGFYGWQWLFVIEGIPTLLVGFISWFYLCDRPRDARWLSPAERVALEELVEREKLLHEKLDTTDYLTVFTDRRVVGLGAIYALISVVLTGVPLWLPQIMRTLELSYVVTGVLVALPPLFGTVVMILWGRSSDRRAERILHIVFAMLMCACGWLLAASQQYAGFGAAFTLIFGMMVANAGVLAALAVFWTLPARSLSGAAAASGIAFISAVGNIGSMIGPPVVGHLRDLTHGFSVPFLFMAGVALLSGILLPWLIRPSSKLKNSEEEIRVQTEAKV